MPTTTATTTPSSLTRITNFYKTLLEAQPDATYLANQAKRVDSGDTTIAKVLYDIFRSPSRSTGHADEWAEAFFVLTGHAGDYATFGQGMDLLRTGMSFTKLMDLVLDIPGHRLSNSGIKTNLEYINTLYSLLTNGETLATGAAREVAHLIDSGTYTRGQVLALTLESDNPIFHGGRSDLVQKSLIFLAGANKEANSVDLLSADGNLTSDILLAMDAAGISPPAGLPFFVRPAGTSDTLQLKGELSGDLIFNLSTGTYTLGGAKAFRAYYSTDGGIDAAAMSFSPLITANVSVLDARQAGGKGKLIATGDNTGLAYQFYAPAAGSTLQGGSQNDLLVGGNGVDRLVATAGVDTLTGGAGVDTFVFAQAAYYRSGTSSTTITDFGNDKDVLDFSLLLGAAAPATSKISPILATSTTPAVLANGGVALLENDGAWVDAGGTQSRQAASADILALFGAAAVFKNPTTASRHVVITADLSTGADVWLINNDSAVTQISANEIFLVGHIDGDWNVMLNGLLPTIR